MNRFPWPRDDMLRDMLEALWRRTSEGRAPDMKRKSHATWGDGEPDDVVADALRELWRRAEARFRIAGVEPKRGGRKPS